MRSPLTAVAIATLVVAVAPLSPLQHQHVVAQGAEHVYHITAVRAAPGRFADLLKVLTAPAPDAPPFSVVFRHREGDEWDFLLVDYEGERATIQVAPQQPAAAGPSFPDVVAWHGDSYAAGPPLEEFRKALNLQTTQAAAGRREVYILNAYSAAAGHYDQLRTTLAKAAGQTPGRAVTLRHLEGAPWQFLLITRYDSWRALADDMAPAETPAAPAGDPGLELRQHISRHTDTIATAESVLDRRSK
jgi:hypothetical protein